LRWVVARPNNRARVQLVASANSRQIKPWWRRSERGEEMLMEEAAA
jgi:hypothetical protein